ncbi:MAG TPA: carboxymuconolactone decarboxylase family protein [Acidobacteriota bacterium]|jgi:uncharacterized peroxidase-related enzyme
MPKFLPVQPDAAGERVRQVYSDYEDTFGGPPDNLAKTLAPSSAILDGYYSMFRAVMGDNSLDDKTRELVILKVAKLNECDYCRNSHLPLAKKAGVSDEMIAALEDHEKSELFTFVEKEALSWVEGVTRNPASIDEELFKQLKNHLTQQQIIELTTIAGFYNMVTRLAQALDVEAEGQKKTAGH